MIHLLEYLSLRLSCPSFLLSKFATQLKLIQSASRDTRSLCHKFISQGPALRILGLRAASPKFQGPSSRVLGARVPCPMVSWSMFQGTGCQGPRVTGSRVPEARVPGLRISGSRVPGLRSWFQTMSLKRAIVKSVIKSVDNEWTRNKWGSTPYNFLDVQHTTLVLLIWDVRPSASAIPRLSHSGLQSIPPVSFYTSWEYQKTRGFLMFSGAIEKDQCQEMG